MEVHTAKMYLNVFCYISQLTLHLSLHNTHSTTSSHLHLSSSCRDPCLLGTWRRCRHHCWDRKRLGWIETWELWSDFPSEAEEERRKYSTNMTDRGGETGGGGRGGAEANSCWEPFVKTIAHNWLDFLWTMVTFISTTSVLMKGNCRLVL